MDEWYRVSDVCERLHVDRSSVYRWIREGKIKARFIKRFPNGMIAINSKGVMRPRPSKKVRKPDRMMPPGDEADNIA